MKIIFETERLIFRRFTQADTGLLLTLNSDPAVLKYLDEPVLDTEDKAAEVLKNIILPQYELNLGRWALHQKEDKKFIGWCGLKLSTTLHETDLGYRLMKTAWGKGYATEAASHTLKYAFETLQVKKITGRAHIENTASIKVMQKIGMKYIRDEIVDHCPVKTFTATINKQLIG